MKQERQDYHNKPRQRGVVLLITLVVVIILAATSFIFISRLNTRRRADQYIIDYTSAQYARDSALKYSLATLEEIKPRLVERPNEPDFSDLFLLTDVQYEEFIRGWLETNNLEMKDEFRLQYDTNDPNTTEFADINDFQDTNDPNLLQGFRFLAEDVNNPDYFTVRGPYGAEWPLVAPPMEFEIGNAKVTIRIEDENAKYPLGWAMLEDENIRREAVASLEIFCERMWADLYTDTYETDTEYLTGQLEEINNVSPFKIKFTSITKLETTEPVVTTIAGSSRTRTTRAQTVRKTFSAEQQTAQQAADFAKIFHSSLIDTDLLARPTVVSEKRKESASKYISLWSATMVNINTAPRNVLEAALVFGGNEVEIAEQIILKRREKPFKDFEELKKELFSYSDNLDKCKDFITTESDVFTIKITAVSGLAKSSAVIGIKRDGKNVQRIAIEPG